MTLNPDALEAAALIRRVLQQNDGSTADRHAEAIVQALQKAGRLFTARRHPDWRGLIFAPRDGTEILAASLSGIYYLVRIWDDGPNGTRIEGFASDGSNICSWSPVGHLDCHPLVWWMPLPQPPQAGGPHAQEDPQAGAETPNLVKLINELEATRVGWGANLFDREEDPDPSALDPNEVADMVINRSNVVRPCVSVTPDEVCELLPPEPSLEERDLHAALSQPAQAKGPPEGAGEA